jgi:hypothetical protein
MELPQLVARVDAELVGQSLFDLLVSGQRVGRTAIAVQGEHQRSHRMQSPDHYYLYLVTRNFIR